MTEQNQVQISPDDLIKVIGEQQLQLRIANQRIMELQLENEKLKQEKESKKEA